jgi:hypothetical protein
MTLDQEGEQRPYIVGCFIDMSHGIYTIHWVKSVEGASIRNVLHNQRLKRFRGHVRG